MLRDGDIIAIDLVERRLDVEVSPAELASRSVPCVAPPPGRGWLSRYRRVVTNASRGAVLA